jgi:DNA-binding GntR family transcriptional regulator
MLTHIRDRLTVHTPRPRRRAWHNKSSLRTEGAGKISAHWDLEDLMAAPAIDREVATEFGTQSAVQVVVQGILDGIREGRYEPGQRLISQELSHDFRVSRAPVREALHVLAGEGVVDLVPRRGARLRRLSVSQLINFLEFTEALLVPGIRSGVPKMDLNGNRRAMELAFQNVRKSADSRSAHAFMNSLYAYHVELNGISGNYFIDMFYRKPYLIFYSRLLADYLPGGEWDQYIFNYSRIHTTILDGDPHAAVATFVSHMQWLVSLMRRQISEKRQL